MTRPTDTHPAAVRARFTLDELDTLRRAGRKLYPGAPLPEVVAELALRAATIPRSTRPENDAAIAAALRGDFGVRSAPLVDPIGEED